MQETFWAEGAAQFQALRQSGTKAICFDLEVLESALYADAAFGHVDAVLQAEAEQHIDGRRYVPRYLMALIMEWHRLAGIEAKSS